MKIDYLSLLFTIAVFLAAVSCCVDILVRIIRSLIVFAHKVKGGNEGARHNTSVSEERKGSLSTTCSNCDEKEKK